MGIFGIFKRKKSGEERPSQGESGTTIRNRDPSEEDVSSQRGVNYQAADALRRGFRGFQNGGATGTGGATMPQGARSPAEVDDDMLVGDQAPSVAAEAPPIGDDGIWDVFQSEKVADLTLKTLLSGLKNIDAFDLLDTCKEVADQLRRRGFVEE